MSLPQTHPSPAAHDAAPARDAAPDAPRTPDADGDGRHEGRHDGWRTLVGGATLEIDARGRIASVTGATGPLAPLARREGLPLLDVVRASDRVAWLHALDAARRGAPRTLRLTLCPPADGRGWLDAVVRLASGEPHALAAIEVAEATPAAAGGVPGAPDATAELAHELRTPLNAVRGYAQALDADLFGPLAPRQREAVRGIEAASEHLIEIANAVLDGARMRAGDALDAAPGDPDEAVARACAMLEGPAERAGVAIAHRPGAVPAVTHDAAALRQIVLNLVSNAIKASPRGGVVGVDARAVPGGVEIAVRDAGEGIPPAAASGTGAAFSRGIAAEGEATGGVGLSLVRRLCARHGGTLRFAAREGGGTVATVALPRPPRASGSPVADAGVGAVMGAAVGAVPAAPSDAAASSATVPAPGASGAAPEHGTERSIARFEAAFPCRLVG